MFKQPPSRTQGPKGVNVKHVLQILLLLGVCFWLIYQIKHSHDKNEEYDEKESKVSVKTQIGVENFKLGRKDLPREEVTSSEKQPDEEEEEEIRGDDEEMKQEGNKDEEYEHEEKNKHKELEHEEQNKHEMDDQEELDNKGLAVEDEGNGGGDDEIIEHD